MTDRIKLTLMILGLSFVSALANPPDFLHNAKIKSVNRRTQTQQIDFAKEGRLPVREFFSHYKQAMALPAAMNFEAQREIRDELGEQHIRYNLTYKGIPLADKTYILHVKNGRVFRSNGDVVRNLKLDTHPAIDKATALRRALAHIHARRYMWQSPKNESFIKKEQNDPSASFFPKGRLVITTGRKAGQSGNPHLAWRFDIYAQVPLSRQWVDVDAHDGSIINVISRIETGDIRTHGQSQYDGMVPITVSDKDFPVRENAHWHISRHSAYGGSGTSWWMADSALGDSGGYSNGWYQTLDSDPVTLNGDSLTLSFVQRYAVETPGGEPAGYDAWDGVNVRISTDSGRTWQVLQNPTPAYSDSSLYSFGEEHGEGKGIPGWTGENRNWHPVRFDLSAYRGKTVQIRFAFASDPGYSTTDGDRSLFGWQVDNIRIGNSQAILFSNTGESKGFTAAVREIIIAGNYRLRRASAPGIMTFTSKNTTTYSLAEDIVSDDSLFNSPGVGAGVSAQWIAEEVFTYYRTEHNRNSYDNLGGRILSYVHYDDNYNNAFWDGSRMTFGDGANNQSPLTGVDITAHEMTHGVTEYSAALIYQDESGALNESFSDIFGTAVEFYVKPDKANWLIGEDVGAFRSMSHPESYGDPNTYGGKNWHGNGGTDNGGVHTNSSVQNKWFYLLAAGDAGTNDNGDAYDVTGIGIRDAAKIAYRNLTVYLTPGSQYTDARQGSIMAARDLFGENSEAYFSTIAAWNAVGVYDPPANATLVAPGSVVLSRTELGHTSDTLHVFISNGGIDTLQIKDIRPDNPHFKLAATFHFPLALPYADSLDIPLVFSPDSEKTFHGQLHIFANDTVGLNLEGRGYIVHAVTALLRYGLSGDALFTIDDAGSAAKIGPTGQNTIRDMAVRPSDYILIGVAPADTLTAFYRINAKSGEPFYLQTIPGYFDKVIFETGSDQPLVLNSQRGVLYRINLSLATADSIGNTGLGNIAGLAVNPLDNMLWAALSNGTLYTIDPQNAQATQITVLDQDQIRAIAFDGNGQLFAINEATELLKVNIRLGSAASLGTTGQALIALRIADAHATVTKKLPALLPLQFSLGQNYPNPFNPLTHIRFALPQSGAVTLTVYDMTGRVVATLVNGYKAAGRYDVTFDGSGLASGSYIYRLQAGNKFVQTKKLLLVK